MTKTRRPQVGKSNPTRKVRGKFSPPRLHGPLGFPATLQDLTTRASFLIDGYGHVFDDATPEEAAAAVFVGWTRCGMREEMASGALRTFVWQRKEQWVGFSFFGHTSPRPSPPGSPDPQLVLDYISLIHQEAWERPHWDTLSGGERLRRVRDALTSGSEVVSDGPMQFLADVSSRYDDCVRFRTRADSYQHMANIVMHEDLADPSGDLAAARLLAGLSNTGLLQDIDVH